MYILTEDMCKFCLYVKDDDGKEYRVAYLNYRNCCRLVYSFLGNEKKDSEYKINYYTKDFFSIYDLLKNNDSEILRYIKSLGYKKDAIEEIVTYAFASDHEHGSDFICRIDDIVGFDLNLKRNVDYLHETTNVPVEDIQKLYELYQSYNAPVLENVIIKKTEKINEKPTYKFFYNISLFEPSLDVSVFDFSKPKKTLILSKEHKI